MHRLAYFSTAAMITDRLHAICLPLDCFQLEKLRPILSKI